MDILTFLTVSSSTLTLFLVVLLIMLIGRKNKISSKSNRKVSSDLKKIKEQINE